MGLQLLKMTSELQSECLCVQRCMSGGKTAEGDLILGIQSVFNTSLLNGTEWHKPKNEGFEHEGHSGCKNLSSFVSAAENIRL